MYGIASEFWCMYHIPSKIKYYNKTDDVLDLRVLGVRGATHNLQMHLD